MSNEQCSKPTFSIARKDSDIEKMNSDWRITNAVILKMECDKEIMTADIIRMERYGVNMWCDGRKYSAAFSG